MEKTKDIIRRSFKEATHNELKDSDWDAMLDDLGLNIVSTIDFIMLLEQECAVEIGDSQWSMMSTPNDVARMLDMLMG